MLCTFKPCEIDSNGGFKRENLESSPSTTKNISYHSTLWSHGLARPFDKPNLFYAYYQSAYSHQTWQDGNILWWAPVTHKVWPFDCMVLRDHAPWAEIGKQEQIKYHLYLLIFSEKLIKFVILWRKYPSTYLWPLIWVLRIH